MERTALVTGGSSGIGLAIARALREDGYALTLASRTAEKVEAAATELDAYGVAADVSREEDCERLVTAHRERFGRLDVLVNSAGVGIAGRIEELSVKHIDRQLDVNLRGLILVTRAAVPMLKEAGGVVVNIASIAAHASPSVLPVYAASKAGVVSFTRALNAALQEDGVRATAISPAFVDTPMASYSGLASEEMIRPEDCAETVRLLLRLSPRARIPEVVIERLCA